MLLQWILPLPLLLTTATCRVVRSQLPKRQYTNSSIHGITQTSTDTASTTGTIPACTSTYTPSPDDDCGDVAKTYRIQLHEQEANYPSGSKDCKDLLRGYGICSDETRTTSTTQSYVRSGASGYASATGTGVKPLPLNGTVSNNTLSNGTTATRSNSTITATQAGPLSYATTTLSYTLGTSGAEIVRTVVITHTVVDVMTFTAKITVDVAASTTTGQTQTSRNPSRSRSSIADSSSTPSSSTLVHNLSSRSLPSSTAASLEECSASATPPAAVQEGIVSGCTAYYVAVAGDYCITVANKFDIAVDTFMDWNPAVVKGACTNMLAGDAYCVGVCGSNATATVTSITWSSTTSSLASYTASSVGKANSTSTQSPAASASTGVDAYKSYDGDGSVAAGWPSMDQWVDFESMFEANRPNMKASCAQWGVPNDTDQEIADMKAAIQSISTDSKIDARFILAVVMQESTGCVRVITTQYSHANPGLMQSHDGTGSCNSNNAPLNVPGVNATGTVQNPCPASEIHQMIADGTQGTASGDGMVQIFAQQGHTDASGYYRSARIYNGGSIAASGLLQDGCCTQSYASDVANRLTGWVSAPRTFTP